MVNVRCRVFVSGKVQGVFYRSSTKAKAWELGLKGWVRNLEDGRVEAVFEGDREAVNQIVKWCKDGPPSARVELIEIHWEKYQGDFKSFEVIY